MDGFKFSSFKEDDTPRKKARLGGEAVVNPEEPAVEVGDAKGLNKST